jgi:hypothetical protein
VENTEEEKYKNEEMTSDVHHEACGVSGIFRVN